MKNRLSMTVSNIHVNNHHQLIFEAKTERDKLFKKMQKNKYLEISKILRIKQTKNST